jgi:hypothetical protein
LSCSRESAGAGCERSRDDSVFAQIVTVVRFQMDYDIKYVRNPHFDSILHFL